MIVEICRAFVYPFLSHPKGRRGNTACSTWASDIAIRCGINPKRRIDRLRRYDAGDNKGSHHKLCRETTRNGFASSSENYVDGHKK
jgi:hypothetical protein